MTSSAESTAADPATTQPTQPTPPDANSLISPQSEFALVDQINKAIQDNTTQSDIRVSRMAMMQPQSPEITKQMPGYEQGQIVDNLTREVLSIKGKAPWLLEKGVSPDTLQPIHYCLVAWNFKLPSEYIKWIPKTEQVAGGDRWEFKTLDDKDPRVIAGIWKTQGGTYEGKKPPVTINTNYLNLVIDPELRIPNGYFRVCSFSRTSAQCGQNVASILQSHRMQNLRPWDRCYYLYTLRRDNPQPHYVLQVVRGPLLRDVAEGFVNDLCLQMGAALVNPASGKIFQTMLINSASLGEDEHTGDNTDGEVSTGNSGTEDPFAPPADGAAGAGGAASAASF